MYNTFRVLALIYHFKFILELLMIMVKTPQIYRLTVRNLLWGLYLVLQGESHALAPQYIHEHALMLVLGLQFACTSKCMWSKFGMCIPDNHACIVHTSSAYPRALINKFDTINLAYMHGCTHVKWKMFHIKPMPHACSVKFKLSCTVYIGVHIGIIIY